MPRGRPKKDLEKTEVVESVIATPEATVIIEDIPTLEVREEPKKLVNREKTIIRNGRKFLQTINSENQVISFVEIK